MKWEICYSARALKFIRKNKIEDKIKEITKKFILKYMGEDISIDVKKLKGEWKGYYRNKKWENKDNFESTQR